jgi:MFS family permease
MAQACHSLDRSIIGLVLEPVRREFNLTDTQLGFLAGLAYGLAFSIAALPMGLLGDRFNRRNMLTCVLLLWSGLRRTRLSCCSAAIACSAKGPLHRRTAW